MIDLFSSDTPNGKKVSIMLEEIDFNYKVIKLDLSKGDQFKSDFKETILPLIKKNDYLLIKGSNATGLNKISERLIRGKLNAL